MNYPEHVTGRESAINGWDEVDDDRDVECGDCGFAGTVDGTLTRFNADEGEFAWECPDCGRGRDDEVEL